MAKRPKIDLTTKQIVAIMANHSPKVYGAAYD